MRENRIYQGIPEELVKDYTIEVLRGGQVVWQKDVRDNYLRLNVHALSAGVAGDEVRLHVQSVHGGGCARLFQLEAYALGGK
ncbi:MAG: FAD-dependent oxidoreductase, partial [Clostridia bacterium]